MDSLVQVLRPLCLRHFPARPVPTTAEEHLIDFGFQDSTAAANRLSSLFSYAESLPDLPLLLERIVLSAALAPSPDNALVNFDRFLHRADDPASQLRYLLDSPRALDILFKLFVGSQHLTETLLRTPEVLTELTQQRRLADLRSREEFLATSLDAALPHQFLENQLDALRRYHRREILRIAAADTFGLVDLKSATVQLSLLADALTEATWRLICKQANRDTSGFVILAFGKLGGEELNYSSDIDLLFLADQSQPSWLPLAQSLIRALQETTAEGFMYRVDMRLRPWGRSGELVPSPQSFMAYLRKHAAQWEKQALLKARPIAGQLSLGWKLLRDAESIIYGMPVDEVRECLRESKDKIEHELRQRGRLWGDVKSGPGSIRDIEFITQYLQLTNGQKFPQLRSRNTLDGLVKLADFGFLQADEYRLLTGGYVFLRTIEHALQLMHNKQAHCLPTDRHELDYLARRLDFENAEHLTSHYQAHSKAIRQVFEKHLSVPVITKRSAVGSIPQRPTADSGRVDAIQSFEELTTASERERYAAVFAKVTSQSPAKVIATPLLDTTVAQREGALDHETWKLAILGRDQPGDLSMICGLLFVYGFDILGGDIFTDVQLEAESTQDTASGETAGTKPRKGAVTPKWRNFVDLLTIKSLVGKAVPEVWTRYEADLNDLKRMATAGPLGEAQGVLAKRVAEAIAEPATEQASALLPVQIQIDNDRFEAATGIHIVADDTVGFLYELTNALALCGVAVERMVIRSKDRRIDDWLLVTDASTGGRMTDPDRLQQLKAAIVLIKHFTHLLPHAPNPEAALLHFRLFLQKLFEQANWVEQFSSLSRPAVLKALAQLLGVSDFLWEDFLRQQHSNLFPVLADVDGLQATKSKVELASELLAELNSRTASEWRLVVNAFKDREMFRVDMRHILGHTGTFAGFAAELSDIAEVVVSETAERCYTELATRLGTPQSAKAVECATKGPGPHTVPWTVLALGKFGGRELGFASDIELLFIYEEEGQTVHPQPTPNVLFFQQLAEKFVDSIEARRDGIFHIDLRLRPYGKTGSLAVSKEAFATYFLPDGPAWPYERQALVKMRPVAGDEGLSQKLLQIRDECLFGPRSFDFAAMRALREKQISQLVTAGTINAKLSPGGLVDGEYLVQSLQILHAADYPNLRVTNTLEAIHALAADGILTGEEHAQLEAAYRFQRRLIDALRIVRGDARDLTVPKQTTEEFEFLARRFGYAANPAQLVCDLEHHVSVVQELVRRFTNS